MRVKLLTKHHLEFLSLKGGCTGSSESTLVKMPHCWKSHAAAQSCVLTPESVHCLLLLPLCVTCVRSWFCNIVHCVLSSLANMSLSGEKRELLSLLYFTLIVFFLLCVYVFVFSVF